MDRSLYERLRGYDASGALPMHMPGHKRNRERFPWLTGCEIDITEIDGFDNLNDPQGLFRELSERMARLWGARESIPLVNGSTVGILAALRTAVPKGGKVLAARNCHRSVYHAAELFGLDLRCFLPESDPETGCFLSVSPAAVEEALLQEGNVQAVVITSPTYEGAVSDVASIAEVCHRFGAVLIVDEAHGAHLGFGGFPESAVRLGADIVVQSLHKTLPSPTQTAVLHAASDRVDAGELRRNVSMLQSSSPSYILSSGIDGCVRFMEREGEAACRSWREALRAVDDASAELRHLQILRHTAAFRTDPSKIVVSVAGTSVTGTELAERLRREYSVELELAAPRFALAMTGLGDTPETIGRFLDALRAIDWDLRPAPPGKTITPTLPKRVFPIFDAASAPRERCTPEEALGRVSAGYVWAYPPGSPLLTPGERIEEPLLETVRALSEANVPVRTTAGNGIFCVSA